MCIFIIRMQLVFDQKNEKCKWSESVFDNFVDIRIDIMSYLILLLCIFLSTPYLSSIQLSQYEGFRWNKNRWFRNQFVTILNGSCKWSKLINQHRWKCNLFWVVVVLWKFNAYFHFAVNPFNYMLDATGTTARDVKIQLDLNDRKTVFTPV